jgi:hypothetical protein
MKTSVISAVILGTVCLSAHAQLVLNPGDVFTYHFDTLPFMTGSNSTDQIMRSMATLTFLVQPSSYQLGENVRFEMFEGDQTTYPFLSDSLSDPAHASKAHQGLPIYIGLPNFWQDLDGTIRFTGLSGSLTIDSIAVSVGIPRGTPADPAPYDVYGTVLPVPEPSVWASALFGMGVLYGVRCYRSQRSPKE